MTFVASRVNPNQPMTVPFVVTDDCGEWSTFVGDGSASPPNPTPTPQAGTQTLTFDDRDGEHQLLNGQYPSGVIDWGSNRWFHSGPFGSFDTKSVSFTADLTSASFTFVTPKRLVSLQTYNGGSNASTVSISCAGKPTRSVTLAARELRTINTGWNGTCSAVTLTSSNGWDTNFDTIVYAGS
jgi:hypothetical protein